MRYDRTADGTYVELAEPLSRVPLEFPPQFRLRFHSNLLILCVSSASSVLCTSSVALTPTVRTSFASRTPLGTLKLEWRRRRRVQSYGQAPRGADIGSPSIPILMRTPDPCEPSRTTDLRTHGR